MASGNLMAVFTPQNAIPPSTNYATLDVRNGHLVADYDAATEESLTWETILPPNYGGGGLTATAYGMATSATSGDVKAGGKIERQDSGTDLDADSYATEQAGTATAPATNGAPFTITITFSSGANMDSLAAGEPFRFALARKAADGADTMTGDWELLRVKIVET